MTLPPTQNNTPPPEGALLPSEKDTSTKKDTGEGSDLPLLEHLTELRKRIIRCSVVFLALFILCWAFDSSLVKIFIGPLKKILPLGAHLVTLDVTEGFLAYLNVSFVVSIFLTSPYIFYEIWSFASPGLKENEKKSILPMAMASSSLFIAGAVFAYYVVIPYSFEMLINYAKEESVAMISIKRYLGITMNFMLGCGFAFQTPLAMLFLVKLKIATHKTLAHYRRHAILAAFIIGAILSPPDPTSQILMAVPLVLLYELGIISAKIMGKKQPPPTI